MLDWKRPNPGRARAKAVLRLKEKGLEAELLRSKTSQTASVTIPIPAEHMPTAISWQNNWVKLARIAPATPVFRALSKSGNVTAKRLSPKWVGEIIRERMFAFILTRGVLLDDAITQSLRFSGHSLRAGYATSAALAQVPLWQIRNHMRHKNSETTMRYLRDSETMEENGLIGVGF